MKDNGSQIRERGKEWKDTLMEINMKVILKKEKQMVKVFITGQIVNFMTENGKMD